MMNYSPKSLLKKFKNLVPQLQELGVTRAEAHYSGYGDEGFCDESDYYNADGERIGMIPKELSDAIEDLAFEFSNVHSEGWWNGLGGDGTVYFNVTKVTVKVEHNDVIEEREHSESTYL